jgi:hypothetical protein
MVVLCKDRRWMEFGEIMCSDDFDNDSGEPSVSATVVLIS